jgi:hypothetical protein
MGHQPPQSGLLTALGAVVADTGSERVPIIVNINIIIIPDAIPVCVGLCGSLRVFVCGRKDCTKILAIDPWGFKGSKQALSTTVKYPVSSGRGSIPIRNSF